jgi:hypothetical protein
MTSFIKKIEFVSFSLNLIIFYFINIERTLKKEAIFQGL